MLNYIVNGFTVMGTAVIMVLNIYAMVLIIYLKLISVLDPLHNVNNITNYNQFAFLHSTNAAITGKIAHRTSIAI